jgi:hypothetical protein
MREKEMIVKMELTIGANEWGSRDDSVSHEVALRLNRGIPRDIFTAVEHLSKALLVDADSLLCKFVELMEAKEGPTNEPTAKA